MSISKNINQFDSQSVDEQFKKIVDALNTYRNILLSKSISYADKRIAATVFESTMNSLVGILPNQTKENREWSQAYCEVLTKISLINNIQLSLNSNLLPNKSNKTSQKYTLQGKKLFPRTETVQINLDGTIQGSRGVLAGGLGILVDKDGNPVENKPEAGQNSASAQQGTRIVQPEDLGKSAPRISGTLSTAGAGISSTGKIISGGVTSSSGSNAGDNIKTPLDGEISESGKVVSGPVSAGGSGVVRSGSTVDTVTENQTIGSLLGVPSGISSNVESIAYSTENPPNGLTQDQFAALLANNDITPTGVTTGAQYGGAVLAPYSSVPIYASISDVPASIAGVDVLGTNFVVIGNAIVANSTQGDTVTALAADGSLVSISTAEETLNTDPAIELAGLTAAIMGDAFNETPLSLLGQEETSLIPKGLLQIVKDATSNANTTYQQDVCSLVDANLTSVLSNTISTISYYSSTNYAQLDSALAVIAADVNLTTQYQELKNAIAGSDGLSGTLAYSKAFEEHIHRLSGCLVEEGHRFAEESGESGTVNLVYNDLPQSVMTSILSFDATKYRSAKYFIQGTSGSEHQMTEYSVIHDNAIVYGREVNTTYTIDPFITFSASFSGTNVNVTATSTLSNTNLVIYGIKLKTAKSANSYNDMSQQRILENHRILKTYYSDSVDYISMQSGSLSNSTPIYELSRTINELIPRLTGQYFTSLSIANKQDELSSVANTINTNGAALQSLMDTDHNNFVMLSKRVELLNTAFSWSDSYTDWSAKPYLIRTLTANVVENLE